MFASKVCIVLIFAVALSEQDNLKCKDNEIKVLAEPYVNPPEPRCVPDNCDHCKLIQCSPPLCQGGDVLVYHDRTTAPNCLCCPGCGKSKNPCFYVKCIEAKDMVCPPGKSVLQANPSKNKCCPSCA